MRRLRKNAESNFLTTVVFLKYSFHKNINLWLFYAISRYGCFSIKSLILKSSLLSLYGCFNMV